MEEIKQSYWRCIDNQKRYLNNFNQHHKYFEQQDFSETSIVYRYNNLNLRIPSNSDLVTSDKNILFLGASHTEGIGLNYEDTFPHIVSSSLGYGCYNAGISRACIGVVYDRAKQLIPMLQPDIIILQVPARVRIQVWYQGEQHIPFRELDHIPMKNFCDVWYNDDRNQIRYREMGIDAIRSMAQQFNAGFFYVTSEDFFEGEALIDLSRDLYHPGKMTQLDAAEYIMETMNSV